MSVTNGMSGPRLEYVVRKIKTPIRRSVYTCDKEKKVLVAKDTEVVDAFMVYMPTGHSYRLSYAEVVKRGFDKQPTILNLDRVSDTKSAAGQFKFAINEDARIAAYKRLEEEVIASCTRKHGVATHSIEEREDADAA
jgi:hypothetical protein